jgi:hypothetical protein
MASGEQSAQRRIWLLTYGAGGVNIDGSIFSEYGRLAVDECYTTIDRALKYTLIRLKTKNRDTALRKFMTYCSQKYAIVEQEIFGYHSVSANSVSSELYEHPAFRVLVQHKTESRACFSGWIEAPGLRGGGILASYLRRVSLPAPVAVGTDQDKESEESEPDSAEGGSVVQAVLVSENEQLKSDVVSLRAEVVERTTANMALAAENETLSSKNADLVAAGTATVNAKVLSCYIFHCMLLTLCTLGRGDRASQGQAGSCRGACEGRRDWW